MCRWNMQLPNCYNIYTEITQNGDLARVFDRGMRRRTEGEEEEEEDDGITENEPE